MNNYQNFIYANVNLIFCYTLLFLGLYKKSTGNCFQCQNNKCTIKQTSTPYSAQYITGLSLDGFNCNYFIKYE